LPIDLYGLGVLGLGKHKAGRFAIGTVGKIVDFAQTVVSEQACGVYTVAYKGPYLPAVGLALQQGCLGGAVMQGSGIGGGLVQGRTGQKSSLWVHSCVPKFFKCKLVLHSWGIDMSWRPIENDVLWVLRRDQIATERDIEQGRVVEHQIDVGAAAVGYALARKLVVHLKTELVLPFGQLFAVFFGTDTNQIVQVKVRLQVQIGQALVHSSIQNNGQGAIHKIRRLKIDAGAFYEQFQSHLPSGFLGIGQKKVQKQFFLGRCGVIGQFKTVGRHHLWRGLYGVDLSVGQ